MSQEVQVIQSLDAEGLALNSVSLWNITWHRLLRRKSAIIGMVILGILIIIALTAQWIAPYSPTRSMLDVAGYPVKPEKRQSPCIHAFGCPQDRPQHFMGLDGNARAQVVAASPMCAWVGARRRGRLRRIRSPASTSPPGSVATSPITP